MHRTSNKGQKPTPLLASEIHHFIVRRRFSLLPLILVKNGPRGSDLRMRARLFLKHGIVEVRVIAEAAVQTKGRVLNRTVPRYVAWLRDGENKTKAK